MGRNDECRVSRMMALDMHDACEYMQLTPGTEAEAEEELVAPDGHYLSIGAQGEDAPSSGPLLAGELKAWAEEMRQLCGIVCENDESLDTTCNALAVNADEGVCGYGQSALEMVDECYALLSELGFVSSTCVEEDRSKDEATTAVTKSAVMEDSVTVHTKVHGDTNGDKHHAQNDSASTTEMGSAVDSKIEASSDAIVAVDTRDAISVHTIQAATGPVPGCVRQEQQQIKSIPSPPHSSVSKAVPLSKCIKSTSSSVEPPTRPPASESPRPSVTRLHSACSSSSSSSTSSSSSSIKVQSVPSSSPPCPSIPNSQAASYRQSVLLRQACLPKQVQSSITHDPRTRRRVPTHLPTATITATPNDSAFWRRYQTKSFQQHIVRQSQARQREQNHRARMQKVKELFYRKANRSADNISQATPPSTTEAMPKSRYQTYLDRYILDKANPNGYKQRSTKVPLSSLSPTDRLCGVYAYGCKKDNSMLYVTCSSLEQLKLQIQARLTESPIVNIYRERAVKHTLDTPTTIARTCNSRRRSNPSQATSKKKSAVVTKKRTDKLLQRITDFSHLRNGDVLCVTTKADQDMAILCSWVKRRQQESRDNHEKARTIHVTARSTDHTINKKPVGGTIAVQKKKSVVVTPVGSKNWDDNGRCISISRSFLP